MEFIREGSEQHASGVMDNKMRDCGSTVIFGTQIEDDGKTYLTAYVHANRDGAAFCRNTGSFKKFILTASNEQSASAERTRWVNNAIATAKVRAAKRWAAFN